MMYPRLVLALLASALLMVPARADAQGTGRGAAAAKYRELLNKNTKPHTGARLAGATRLKMVPVGGEPVKVLQGDGSPETVDSLDAGGEPIKIAAKIWAVPVDGPAAGQPCNITKYKWKPNQKLKLFVESAVPLQVSMFQIMPGDQPAVQVLPDERIPQSFATVPAGVAYEFPFLFQMDDNLELEEVSVIIVHAQSDVLPMNNLGVDADIQGDGGSIGSRMKRVFTKINDQASRTPPGGNSGTRLKILAPDGDKISSKTVDDVSYLVVGTGNIGNARIKFFK